MCHDDRHSSPICRISSITTAEDGGRWRKQPLQGRWENTTASWDQAAGRASLPPAEMPAGWGAHAHLCSVLPQENSDICTELFSNLACSWPSCAAHSSLHVLCRQCVCGQCKGLAGSARDWCIHCFDKFQCSLMELWELHTGGHAPAHGMLLSKSGRVLFLSP